MEKWQWSNKTCHKPRTDFNKEHEFSLWAGQTSQSPACTHRFSASVPKQFLIQLHILLMETWFLHMPMVVSQDWGWVRTCSLLHLYVPTATLREINCLSKRHYAKWSCHQPKRLRRHWEEGKCMDRRDEGKGTASEGSSFRHHLHPAEPGRCPKLELLASKVGFSCAEDPHWRLWLWWKYSLGKEVRLVAGAVQALCSVTVQQWNRAGKARDGDCH